MIFEEGLYITGCVKNCGTFLENIFATHISALIANTDTAEVIIAYDVSFDSSLQILLELQKTYPLTILYVNSTSNKRTLNIANGRNKIMEYVRNHLRMKHLIMMDFDDVNSKGTLNFDLIKYILPKNWNIITFNRSPYYDIWALQINNYQISCWHFDNSKKVEEDMRNYITEKLGKKNLDELLECDSSFNGFAIMKTENVCHCQYKGEYHCNIELLSEQQIKANELITGQKLLLFDGISEDCEHKYFCNQVNKMSKKSCKISPCNVFYNESHIVKYLHSKYFRKISQHVLSPDISDATYLLDYDYSTIKKNDTVFVCTSNISEFMKHLHKIKNEIILISNDSDLCFPNDFFTEVQFLKLVGNPIIKKWYVQNCTCHHPKIAQIPIGLDYHTMKNTAKWGCVTGENHQDEAIQKILEHSQHIQNRKIACYCNFHFKMDTRYCYDRYDALKYIDPNLLVMETDFVPRFQSHIHQSKFAFVISPLGNGLDCHRTWEALALGCIPIIKKSDLQSQIFHELPVLVVEQWADVTHDLLVETVRNIAKSNFNTQKLYCEYWYNIIRAQS